MKIVGEVKEGISVRTYPEIDFEGWYREHNSNYQGPLENFENYRYTYSMLGRSYYDRNDVEALHYQKYAVKTGTLPNGEHKAYLLKYTDKYMTGEWEDWQEEFIAVYDDILFDDYQYIPVKDGDEWKYIDYAGNVVSDSYERATIFNDDGYALVIEEDRMAYIVDNKFRKLQEIPTVTSAEVIKDMFYLETYGDMERGIRSGSYVYYFDPDSVKR